MTIIYEHREKQPKVKKLYSLQINKLRLKDESAINYVYR